MQLRRGEWDNAACNDPRGRLAMIRDMTFLTLRFRDKNRARIPNATW